MEQTPRVPIQLYSLRELAAAIGVHRTLVAWEVQAELIRPAYQVRDESLFTAEQVETYRAEAQAARLRRQQIRAAMHAGPRGVLAAAGPESPPPMSGRGGRARGAGSRDGLAPASSLRTPGRLCCPSAPGNGAIPERGARRGRLAGLAAGLLMLLLAACGSPDPALLSDAAAAATATVCGCFPYGSYPHTIPSGTPTPTGTWVPPTASPTPTPTRPARCDFCTMAPAPTTTRPAWPPPLLTCTPAADQPTLTPRPTLPPALFPTLPPNTPLPAVLGDTNPTAAGSLEGEALPGGVAGDPRNGRARPIWSQFDPDPSQEPAGRIYLQLQDPASGQWLPARSVNGPGRYKIGGGAPESAVGLAPDGTLYVAYVRADGANALLEWRVSPDAGATWSAPADLPYPSSNQELYNLRLVVDAACAPHLAALVVQAGCDPRQPCGDLVYYERRADGSWRAERRPVSARGARQYNLALTTGRGPAGAVRTTLLWNEEQAVYAAYKDGPDGAWSRPVLLIDGQSDPDGIPDYLPGGTDHSMQVLAFAADGQSWVYAFWSLYSTGRICFSFSRDGGATWSAEDALAYYPIPGPTPPPVNATVHAPIPFWDAGHRRLFVVYQFCDRTARDAGGAGCYPVFAYGPPGAPGAAWTRAAGPTQEPLRLFAPTLVSAAQTLRGSVQPAGGTGPAWLIWRENTGAPELYRALLAPATLLSGAALP